MSAPYVKAGYFNYIDAYTGNKIQVSVNHLSHVRMQALDTNTENALAKLKEMQNIQHEAFMTWTYDKWESDIALEPDLSEFIIMCRRKMGKE